MDPWRKRLIVPCGPITISRSGWCLWSRAARGQRRAAPSQDVKFNFTNSRKANSSKRLSGTNLLAQDSEDEILFLPNILDKAGNSTANTGVVHRETEWNW